MTTISIVWISIVTFVLYLIHRLNWSNYSFNRIRTITQVFLEQIEEDVTKAVNNGDIIKAEKMMSMITNIAPVGVGLLDKTVQIIIFNKKKVKNMRLAYFFKVLKNPISYKTTTFISNKIVWNELNNLMYGENNWE